LEKRGGGNELGKKNIPESLEYIRGERRKWEKEDLKVFRNIKPTCNKRGKVTQETEA